MKTPASMPGRKGFRFPREVVSYAVWAYHRFALSTADVEDLLAERGVIVTRETIRLRGQPVWPPFRGLRSSRSTGRSRQMAS